MKSFFEVVPQLAIGGVLREVNHCARGFYKAFVVKAKVSAFAAIFIPCLLQFPLMAFGQERTNGVNGGLVPVEVSGESVNGKGIVGNGSGAVGEGRLEGVNGISNDQVPLQRKGTTKSDERNQDGGESASIFGKDFDHWWIGFLVFIPLWPFLFAEPRMTPNVELRRLRGFLRRSHRT
jgi:hypothetical protein